MNWTEICVSVNARDAETASAVAGMAAPGGIYIEDYSDLLTLAPEIAHIDLIDDALLKKDADTVKIRMYFPQDSNAREAAEYISERLLCENIAASIDFSSVEDADWAENWKKYFKPFELGERLAVCPSWEEYKNRQGRAVLKIDPGAAFGTGSHATTRMCLLLLDELTSGGESVLDIGCGSGILSIAALLLGASYADGVDIDPQSVAVARENAEINGVSDKARYFIGDLTDKISGKYSIVCANIVADVIIRLCGGVSDYMEEDGVFICSGIIDLRREEVLNALSQNGFTIIKETNLDGWCAFAAKKEKNDA